MTRLKPTNCMPRIRRITIMAIAFAIAVISSISKPVLAQTEVTLLAPIGIRAPIEQLIAGFEHQTGYKVNASFGTGGETKQQIARGEVFDVPVIQRPYPQVLASGNVLENTATPLAAATVGVAVKKGAHKPDISTPETVKQMLLTAKSIVCPDAAIGATAGATINDMLKTLGIDEQVEPKLRRIGGAIPAGEGGPTGMVARGEAEIVMTFISEMNVPGVDIVGALPEEIAPRTILVGFVSTHAKNPKAAREFLQYLSSPEAAWAYKASRMELGK